VPAHPLHPVLLIGNDLSTERQTCVKAQMGNGDEGGALHVCAKIELADDAAFVTHVVKPVIVQFAEIGAAAF
jgi:hypothetical protein